MGQKPLLSFQGLPVKHIQEKSQLRAYALITCQNCGKEAWLRVDWLRRGKRRTCSKRCASQLPKPSQIIGKRKSNGYSFLYSPQHPRARKSDLKGYVAEHILVAEKRLGRSLYPHEVVHHINANKSDNRPENLEVMTRKRHAKLHGLRGFVPCRFCGRI